MSTASNPPMPNPGTLNGFLVTVSLPSMLAASRFRRGDVFVLPGNPNDHLMIENIAPHPELGLRLIVTVNGKNVPFTLHVDDPVQPVSMRRAVQVTCRLCQTATTADLDLVTHGEPQDWVCNRH
ncbi:hypothetical protein ABZ605_02890 [Streptomyces sp. NPDC012765]|uniref:hypothetical protein n=1 Tax=Streptomyces sp. NPDC012765 TaxID=3155249 RepID=UPI0033F62025